MFDALSLRSIGCLSLLLGSAAYASPPAEPANLKWTSSGALSWDPSAGALAYHLYGGDVADLSNGTYGSCRNGNIEASSTSDTATPAAGQAFFYLVAAMNEDGESAAGHDSNGTEHAPAMRCLAARRLFPLTENGAASDGVLDGQNPRRGNATVTSITITNEGRDRLRVHSGTGEVETDSVDLSIAARKQGDADTLRRAYRSQIVFDGPLGMGWEFGDNMRLARSGADMLLFDGSGRREIFRGVAGGSAFIAPPGLYGRLIRNADGSFTLRAKGVVKGCGGGNYRASFFDVFIDTPLGLDKALTNNQEIDDDWRLRSLGGSGGDGPAWAAINTSHSNIKNLLYGGGGGAGGVEAAINNTKSNIKNRMFGGGSGGAGGVEAAINNTKSNIKNRMFGGGGDGPVWAAINTSHSNIKNLLYGGGGGGAGGVEAAINNTKSNIKNLMFGGGGGSVGIAVEEQGIQFAINEPGVGRGGVPFGFTFRDDGMMHVPAERIPIDQAYPDILSFASGVPRGVLEAGPFEEGVQRLVPMDPDIDLPRDFRKPSHVITYRFDSRGRLVSEEDQLGNRTSYLYDNQSLLRTVVDTLGRVRSFDYNAEGRVSTVTDNTGRQVRYIYSGSGNGARLVEVQRPVGGGLAPNRTLYSYSTGNADPRLNNNLLSITTPAQAASGGAPTVQISYGAPGTFQADRAMTMSVGGINASGFPAGGTFLYSYSALNPGADPSLIDLPRRRCVMTDPNGNESQHDTNAQLNLLTLVERTNRNLRPGEPDYTTELRYNQDGELLEVEFSQGNRWLMTYDRPGADRYREGNLLELRSIADTAAGGGRGDGHGGESHDLVWTFSYEPLFNRLAAVTGPKGNDPSYLPPNGGVWSAARYTAKRTFDYQEGNPASNGVNALATQFGIVLGAFPLNLGDLNGDGRLDQMRGAPLVDEAPAVLLDAGSRQAAIEGSTTQPALTLYRYNDFGQVIELQDPEFNTHQFSYYSERDPDGDGIPTPNPPDGRTLSNSEGGMLAFGLLDKVHFPRRNNGTDPTPAMVRDDYRYDALSRLVRHVDGRGVATRFVWNDADAVTEIVHAAATADASGPLGDAATGRGETGLTPFAYRTRFQHDRDGNLRKLSLEDRDLTRNAGPFVETSFTPDILGQLRRLTWPPVLGSAGLLTSFSYDANGNLIEIVGPAGDAQTLEWDERDLLLSSTAGAGTATAGTKTFAYWPHAHQKSVTDERGNVTDFDYDGHDRLVRAIDAVGGVATFQLEPDDAIAGLIVRGTVGGPTPVDRSGSANVKLVELKLQRDERGRVFRVDRELFVPLGAPALRAPELSEGPLTPGDGHVSSGFEYDRIGRLTFTSSDTLAGWRYEYDGLSRLVRSADVDGDMREVLFAYDGASNPIEDVSTDFSSVAGPPQRTAITTSFFDALGRHTLVADNTGRTYRFVWNSASDLAAVSDANGPLGGAIQRRSEGHTSESVTLNSHGNVTRYSYDALGRRIRTEAILTASGQGDGTLNPIPDTSNPFNPDGVITTQNTFDTTRLTQVTDDNGHRITYQYDARNRVIRRIADDDTVKVVTYDAASNSTSVTDANGSVTLSTYDRLDRLARRDVNRAIGVAGTTLQTYEYDGLSRLTRSTDNNDPSFASDDVELRLVYDSLGRQIEEQQLAGGAAPSVTSRAWHGGVHLASTSPAGRRTEYSYDALDRRVSAREMTTGADWNYRFFGTSLVHTLETNTGLRATLLDSSGSTAEGLDANDQVTRWRALSGSNLLADFEHGYDRVGRTTFERRLHDPGGSGGAIGRACQYDAADRLVHSTDGELDSSGVLVSAPRDERHYTRDGRGNWNRLVHNGVTLQSTPNNLDEYDEPQSGGTRFDDGLADDFLDPLGGPPDGWNLAHDKNGNETDAGPTSLAYDFAGRVVRATRDADAWVVGTYAYDASDRRVRRETSQPGQAPQLTRYLYDGSQIIEERDNANAVSREFVLSGTSSGLAGGRALAMIEGGKLRHLMRDAAGNVAVVAESGLPTPLERRVYDPHGKPTFQDAANNPKLDAFGAPKASSDFGVSEGWFGCRYDGELSQRSSNPLQDWGGAYSCRGNGSSGAQSNPLYDSNKGRYLVRDLQDGAIDGVDAGPGAACGGSGGQTQRWNCTGTMTGGTVCCVSNVGPHNIGICCWFDSQGQLETCVGGASAL